MISPTQVLARPAVRRVLASAFVAGGLGLALRLVFYIGSRSHVSLCNRDPMSCLGVAIIAVLAAILAIVILAWPLLYAAGVRPAWPVALLGPVINFAMYGALMNLAGSTGSRYFVIIVSTPAAASASGWLVSGSWIVLAISYAAAAVITAPRLYRYWSPVVAIAVVAFDLATMFAVGR